MIGGSGRDKRYLSLGIPMVNCVYEAIGAKGIAKLWCELRASFRSVCFGQIDDDKISKVN